MLPLWMAYATLFSAIVAGIAVVADHVAGIWDLPRRYVWIAALVAVVFVPPALAFRPVKDALETSSEVQRVHIEWPTTVASAPQQPRRASMVNPTPVIRDWSRPVAAGWLTLSIVLLGLLARDFLIVRRRKSRWTPAQLDGESVLIGDDVGPAVVGALRASIVVPSWAVELDAENRELMLRHEAEHIRAGDPRVLLAAAIALVLVPWNAALWLIVRRLRLAVEIDCDARVLRALGRPREYGMLLITVGARHSLSLPLAASLAEERPLLERRIVAMTMSRPSRPLIASLPFGLLVAAAGGLLAQTPVPAPFTHTASASTSRIETASVSRAAAARADSDVVLRAAAKAAALAAPQREEPRITAEWEQAPIEVVSSYVAKFTKRSIVVTDAARGTTISGTVRNEPWDSAFRRLLLQANLVMRASRDTIVVDVASTKGPIPIDTITAWILVHHQDAFRAAGSDLRITIVVDENDHYVTSELSRIVDDVRRIDPVTGQPAALAAVVKDREIQDVEVVKGAAAAAAYGKAAENGVVVVRTKTGVASVTTNAGVDSMKAIAERKKTLMAAIEERSTSALGTRSPLYIVDGVVVPDLNGGQVMSRPLSNLNIDPNSIASVDVLKFPAGKITPDALGVILVKLKGK